MDKKNTQQKPLKQKLYKKNLFTLIGKKNLTENVNLSGPPNTDSKCTNNHVFSLHDPLDTIPLSKVEIENIFLPTRE